MREEINKVWTPNSLGKIIVETGGKIDGDTVRYSKDRIKFAVERGAEKVSRYKISSIFFVYTADCKNDNNNVVFNIDKVWQLNPVITAKMFFKNLNIDEVKTYYRGDLE